jgi:hypothetical protein
MRYMHSYASNWFKQIIWESYDGYDSILMHLVDQEFHSLIKNGYIS